MTNKFESYDQHGFFGTRIKGGRLVHLQLEVFSTKKKYSWVDCLDLLSMNQLINDEAVCGAAPATLSLLMAVGVLFNV